MTIFRFDGDYRWLSNFHPSEVEFEGQTYATVEHAYVAAKTLVPSERKLIRETVPPGQVKRIGKKLTLRSNWTAIRIPIMRDLIHKKFLHPELRNLLIATANERLEEGNSWGDTFWGVDINTRKGQNWLGNIIMEERTSIIGYDEFFIY